MAFENDLLYKWSNVYIDANVCYELQGVILSNSFWSSDCLLKLNSGRWSKSRCNISMLHAATVYLDFSTQ